MSARQREFIERQRAASSISNPSLNCFVATVVDYRADGKGAAVVWVDQPHADDPNQRLGPIPIMADWAGASYGSGTGPASGALAVVMNLSRDGDDFIVLGFLHSKPEPSPKVPQGERWMVHKNGSYAKIVNDGPTVGDKLGGNRTGGGALIEHKTRSGHTDTFDDTAQAITRKTAHGHADMFSDAQDAITRTVQSTQQYTAALSAAGIPAGSAAAHILTAAGENAHLAVAGVALGDRLANMTPDQAAINKAHLQAEITNLRTVAKADLQLFANAMIAAAVPNAAAIMGLLSALGVVKVSNSSAIVTIK